MIQILPSLLAADGARLGEEIRHVEASGADALHLDIMDAHFVPNLSFGPDVVRVAARCAPTLYRHVHLMLTRPDLYVAPFADAGAQTIQIHIEADCDIWQTLRTIRDRGLRSGLVLRPQTPPEAAFPYLDLCDEVLFMTVNPGYGGQSFMPEVLPHIEKLRNRLRSEGRPAFDIMVDGGVNFETGAQAAAAGANQFVAGSFLFRQPEMGAAVAALRDTCECAFHTRF